MLLHYLVKDELSKTAVFKDFLLETLDINPSTGNAVLIYGVRV